MGENYCWWSLAVWDYRAFGYGLGIKLGPVHIYRERGWFIAFLNYPILDTMAKVER